MEGTGRNNGSIMESFKREFAYGALIVNTKKIICGAVGNLAVQDPFIH